MEGVERGLTVWMVEAEVARIDGGYTYMGLGGRPE